MGRSFKNSGIPRIGGRVALCLPHSLSRGVQRIQPIIKFIFSPRFVGLKTQAMQQSETPFYFPILKQNKNLGFSQWNWEIGMVPDLY